MSENQAMELFNFRSQHNGVDCIESLDPKDKGTERQYWFSVAMLTDVFDVPRQTMYDNIQSLIDDDELVCTDFRTDAQMLDSSGVPHRTTLYNLEVLNKLGMCCFRSNKKARAIRNAFNDVLVKHETQAVLPQDYLSALKALVASEEAKQRALAERDDAVRTKYLFVEGRDAKVCGELGGLRTQNEKLREQVGDARNWKQAKAIEWLPDYFDISIKGFWSQVGKKLTATCKEIGVEVRRIEDSAFGTVGLYPIKAIKAFHEKVHRDLNLLQKFRKRDAV